MVVQILLNHIHGKIGRRWARFIKETGIDHMLIVSIDAAKFTHKAIVCTFHVEVVVPPFEFDASLTGFDTLKKCINQVKHEGIQEVIVGIETTSHYYDDLVRHCCQEG